MKTEEQTYSQTNTQTSKYLNKQTNKRIPRTFNETLIVLPETNPGRFAIARHIHKSAQSWRHPLGFRSLRGIRKLITFIRWNCHGFADVPRCVKLIKAK